MPPLVLTLARAETLINAEWRAWSKRHGSYTITDMLLFYFGWLKNDKPKLLAFPYQGQQWQVVRAWLQRDESLQVHRRKSQAQDRPLSHTFTAMKSSDERYQSKVSWPQLSDDSNTPERTKQRLVTDDVAGRIKGKSRGGKY